jgi:hypothetical protein
LSRFVGPFGSAGTLMQRWSKRPFNAATRTARLKPGADMPCSDTRLWARRGFRPTILELLKSNRRYGHPAVAEIPFLYQ